MDIVEKIDIKSIPHRRDRPYVLVDGILKTSHNALINIAIAKAINEVHGFNVGYLCIRENSNHYCDRLFRKAGVVPFELSSGNHLAYKARAVGSGLVAMLTHDAPIKELDFNGIHIGDLVYDSIIRSSSDVYTLEHANFWQKLRKVSLAIQLAKSINSLMDRNDVQAVSLSHKVYARFGVLARISTASGATFFSRSRAHINRISKIKEHYVNDYKLTASNMKRVIEKVGIERMREYMRNRFSGDLNDHDVQNAFADKKHFEEPRLERKLSTRANRPVVLIAPHVFSDAPHSDRDMVYEDYYKWFIHTLDITQSIPDVQWLVKPHPSAEMYEEGDVVRKLVQEKYHVQLVPNEAATNSILEISDAVVTVRGTIGMEALMFDCDVILAGNAIYDDIASVIVCENEREYMHELTSLDVSGGVPMEDKKYAMAAIYYRAKSYNYVSPLFGPERAPDLSKTAQVKHDRKNIESYNDFIINNRYSDSDYYRNLVNYFRSQSTRLSIIDLL
jgi:hypothetical protein